MTTDFASKIKKGPVVAGPRIVIMGMEGVGKTTAAAQCPSPIFLCGENGLIGSAFSGIANYAPENWADVLGFLEFILAGNHDYKTLVIDTIDWIEPLLHSHINKRDGKYLTKDRVTDGESIENFNYQKGYVLALEEFRKALAILDKIRLSGMIVVLNAHTHIKNFSNPEGENYDRYELKINAKLAGLIREWADAMIFAKYETFTGKIGKAGKSKGIGGQKRIVCTERTAAYDAKNRYSLPPEMPLDMAEILEAIKKGESGDTTGIVEEINAYLPCVAESKRAAIANFIEEHKGDSVKLSQALNKARVLAEQQEQKGAVNA